MTETVEQLKARAELAVKLATDIQSLKVAAAERLPARMKFENRNGDAYLTDNLLREVIGEGLAKAIQEKESRLNLILSPLPTATQPEENG